MEHEPVGSAPGADDAARLRRRLVDELRSAGRLDSPEVARAMDTVPRDRFTPPGTELRDAYADRVVVLATDRSGAPISTVSQPAMVALMLEQLDVRAGHRILEVGTGSGYNTALLAELTGPGGHVTSIEVDDALLLGAAARLAELAPGEGTPLDLRRGDGWLGVPGNAPYDRLESTIGVDDIPPAWREQLADGGLLVAPVWLRPGLELSVAMRRAGPVLHSVSVTQCGFLQLRGPHGADPHSRRLGSGLSVVGDGLTGKDVEIIRALAETAGVDIGRVPGLTERRWWGVSLSDPRAVLFTGRYGTPVAWGIYEPDGPEGPGLAIGSDGTAVGHGDPIAAEILRHRLEDAPEVDPSRLTVTAFPAGHPVPPPPADGHSWRITRAHHRYRIHAPEE
ncbi:hypothetical protein [Yinghuangia soli]|uniref:Protein-L-isoaspartate O-methyltransferase n=1 Tax=Yinghuangia soli TaxID=2908204 RepID=A0AA41Q4X5_9ACTN|nr:hypothetical protein [Yinghuangia soli]MCF2531640.1 hypothetical protein [Yinghuangia soli]